MNSLLSHIARYALPVVSVIISVFALCNVVELRYDVDAQHKCLITLQDIEIARQNLALKEQLRNARSDSASLRDDLLTMRRRP